MKNISKILSMGVIIISSFVLIPTTTEAAACPWTTGGDNLVVGLTQSVLFSSNEPRQNTTAVDIPAGTYDVFGYTYDAHSAHGGQNQYYEQVYFSFRNAAGTVIANTPATADIPEGSDVRDTILGKITLSEDIKTVYSIHAVQGQGNYQSVYPVCILLQKQAPPTPDLSISCSASPSNPEMGETVNWNANPSGGNGSYTYNWTGSVTSTNKSPSTSYNSTGTKTATVTVTSGSQTKTATCSVNVQDQPQLTGSCSASPNRTSINNTVTWEVFASGASGSYTYDWSGASLDGEHGKTETRSYGSTGTKTATVNIISTNGQSKSVSCSTVIEETVSDFDVNCRVSDTRVEKGDSVTFTTDVDGGTSPYSYNWRGDVNGNNRTVTVRFDESGTYRAEVTVRDNNDRERTDSCPSVVVGDEEEDDDDLEVSCKVSDTSIYTDDRVTFTADVDGGNSPYEYSWRGDISGDDRTESVRFNRDGRYEVRLTVEDDDGNRASDTCPVVRVSTRNTGTGTITTNLSQPPSGQLSSLSSVFLSQVPYTGAKEILTVIGYIALIFVWSVGIVYFLARKRSKKTKTNNIEAFKNINKQAVVIE